MLKNIIKKIIFKIVFAGYYKFNSVSRIRSDKVVFVEMRILHLSDNFKLLDKELKKKGYKIEYVYLKNGKTSFVNYIVNCFKLIKAISNAKFVFLNEGSNVISALKIRKGTKIIQTWHACGAFKKFGYALEKKPTEDFYKNYSLVTVSSDDMVDIYEKTMNISSKDNIVRAMGVSRTDVFFDSEFRKNANIEFKEKYGISTDKKIILYAPTFRGNAGKAYCKNVLDIDKMYEKLKDEYILLVKYHPALNNKLTIEEKYRDFVYDISDCNSIDSALCMSDVCITDYSSVVFEFSLLERPMIFFAYDLDEYVDDRGFFEKYEDFVPGPIVKTTEELIKELQNNKFDINQIKKFKNKYMGSCDGRATERILKYMES